MTVIKVGEDVGESGCVADEWYVERRPWHVTMQRSVTLSV